MTTRHRCLCVPFLLVAWPAWAQDPAQPDKPAAGTAVIAGRITAADTGRPVSGVTLSLMSWQVMRVPKTTTSDAAGRFEFTGLVAGSYLLESRPERYLRTSFGQVVSPDSGRPIVVKDGERFTGADIALLRPGAIDGHIVDEFGDPAPNVMVEAYRVEFAAGARRLMPTARGQGNRLTDDTGHFRIFGLAPGTYHVCALSGAFADPNAAGGFAPTFAPGTTDVLKSRPVAVRVGADTADIVIPLVPARAGRVAGTLVGPSGTPVRGSVLLTIQDKTGASPLMARGASGPDGAFAFRNVPAGAYTLQAFGSGEPGASGALGQAPFGYVSFASAGTDVDGLRVVVRTGVTARGKITFEGDDAPRPKPAEVRVFPRPVEFESAPIVGGGPPRFTLSDDWVYEVRDMSGWRVVRVDVQSADWSLARVMVNGADVTDAPVDFRTGDVDGLDVVLTSRGARLSGSVVAADGAPSREYVVVAFAEDRERWPFPSRFVAMARSNQDGGFEIRGLPPETYLVGAVPRVTGFEWQDPDFLERLRPQAERVVLGEGDATVVRLRLSPPGSR